jgi:hypothetical protein
VSLNFENVLHCGTFFCLEVSRKGTKSARRQRNHFAAWLILRPCVKYTAQYSTNLVFIYAIMNKEQIAQLLGNNHTQFIHQIQQLNDADLLFAPEGKWTAAQQLDHIVKSVSPVNMAMGLPKFILKWKFGVANRPSKTYEGLVEKYTRKLQEGGKASGRFVPEPVGADAKEKLITALTKLVNQLAHRTEKHSEEALDKYILPHPLLGKLTLREMLYFTAYHVQHHGMLVERGLKSK